MITVVPVRRMAPMAGKMPLRTFHSAVHSAASVVKRKGVTSSKACSAAVMAAIFRSNAAAVSARVSTSSAAPSAGSATSAAGMPGLACTARSEARSSSSTAATGVRFRLVTTPHAVSK